MIPPRYVTWVGIISILIGGALGVALIVADFQTPLWLRLALLLGGMVILLAGYSASRREERGRDGEHA